MLRLNALGLLTFVVAATASAACDGIPRDNDRRSTPGTDDGKPPAPPPVAGLTCGDASYVRPSEIRRLNHRELSNTYLAAFGPKITAAIADSVALLGSDDEIRHDPRDLKPSFEVTQLEAIDRISRRLAGLVAATDEDLTAVAGACAVATPPGAACVEAFVSRLGKQLFRRPLAPEETKMFGTVFAAAATSREGFGDVVASMVLAPDFLYHVELGAGQPGSDTQFALTNHEIAARLAYETTDGPPDAPLTAAADDGSLRDPAVLGAQADRLLASALGRAKVRRFVGYWLLLDRFQGLPTSAAYLDGIDPTGLPAEMRRELDAFVDHIVYEQHGSFADLLTSRRSFAQAPALAKIHGHPVPSSATDEMSSDAAHAGLLLRGPLLADSSNRTHPILRGAFMLRRVVCTEIGSPTEIDLADRDAAKFVPDPVKHSTAQMMVQQTAPATCSGCHAKINPFGIVLEGFDNLGRARGSETMFDSTGAIVATHPVVTSATLPLSADETVTAANAPEMMTALAKSVAAPLCFTRHAYRYYRMQREAPEDGCQLSSMFHAMQEPKGSILQNIKASLVNVSLDQRRIP